MAFRDLGMNYLRKPPVGWFIAGIPFLIPCPLTSKLSGNLSDGFQEVLIYGTSLDDRPIKFVFSSQLVTPVGRVGLLGHLCPIWF